MRRILSIFVVLMLLLTLVSAVGCSKQDKVGDILANPAQYEGKDVNIKGYVGNTFWVSLVNKGAFEVGDGSGTIWVVTTTPPPQKGVQVSVTGSTKPAFTLGDRTLGTVVVESKRS